MLTKPIISEIFVETKAVRRVRDAIEFAMISPYPAHVISSPGRGKTTALYHLAREYDGAYLEIGEQQKTPAGLYRGLLEAIGAIDPSGLDRKYERDLFDSVIHHMTRRMDWSGAQKDLLVVDEFQTAEDRTKRELLRLHETCGFALVLSGNAERLASSGKRDPVALQQIEDRIGARFFLPKLDQSDCDLIAKAYGVKDEAALWAARTLGTKGNARELVQTLQMARHGAQGGAVSLSNIREALVLVTGKTDALKVLNRANR
ncbi:AAA family ATPase [Rhodovulum tesquicola]|uniref:AAA family ATPase n=1 Tax=Rhodovulum tesquicola TaxID=540254 RepID=UPI002097D7C7|nr:AAA family ATPase [Rhodovulum tesquicola]MCO8146859.1 AAA family ATPase [Rhodovulum tesquicola]